MRRIQVAVISSKLANFNDWLKNNSEENKDYFKVSTKEDLVGRKIDELIISDSSKCLNSREEILDLCRKILTK